MAKQKRLTVLDKAIARLDDQIAALQLAKQHLLDEQTRATLAAAKPPTRTTKLA
jgi:hypothetical protein